MTRDPIKRLPPTLRRHQGLARRLKRLFKCDSARISSPLNETMFLIIGHKRTTRRDKNEGRGVWVDERGREKHFTYIEEMCVASGDTAKELIASARLYKRACGITMLEYIQSLTPNA